MRTATRSREVWRVIVAVVSVLLLAAHHAEAQKPIDTVEESKVAVVQAFCAGDGKIAKCVGLSGSDCQAAMRPLVDTCYEKKDDLKASQNPQSAFSTCFWVEFSKKYGQSVQYTDECFPSSKDAPAARPIPRHLEKKMEILNPEGTQHSNVGELGY